MRRAILTALLLAPLAGLPSFGADQPDRGLVSFNRDIRPILSQKCFPCHGPDAKTRKAKLRLDQRGDAIADRGGYAPVVPGKAASSEVMARVLSDDPAERMPPARLGKRLTEREVQLLRDWIDQGVEYQTHWAFGPLVASTPTSSARPRRRPC
jgi:hypothetical protein